MERGRGGTTRESEQTVNGDVLIVGAGIAGLSTAIAPGPARHQNDGGRQRAAAAVGASILITHRAVYALEELGVLDQILEVGRQIRASEPSWWTYV